jgi:hypothetical protein
MRMDEAGKEVTSDPAGWLFVEKMNRPVSDPLAGVILRGSWDGWGM